MKMYRIRLSQRVVEEASVEVLADSPLQAYEKAIALANVGKVDWEFLEAPDPVQVDSINEV